MKVPIRRRAEKINFTTAIMNTRGSRMSFDLNKMMPRWWQMNSRKHKSFQPMGITTGKRAIDMRTIGDAEFQNSRNGSYKALPGQQNIKT